MKNTQMSLKEAGQFDFKRNHPVLKWTEICAARAKAGISRKARIWRKLAARKVVA